MNTTTFEKVRAKVPAGVHLQLYRGAMRGGRPQLLGYLDECARLYAAGAIAGVVLHGFPQELEKAAKGLADECRSRGLHLGFSYGLDGTRDNDGTELTALEKGACMGRVAAAHPDTWTVLDLEGKWDTDGGDGMNEATALAMVRKLRELAPDTVLIDQPWPMPDQHGGPRAVARLIGEGGPWQGYPLDEIAEAVDARAPQLYWTNWKDKGRYERVRAWSNKEWATADKALAPAGLVRPRTVTVQGYGHDPDPWCLADCLLAHREVPSIMWCDPWPEALTLRVLQAVATLRARGYAAPGTDHRAEVRRFQSDAGLKVDGWLGPVGFAKLEPQRKGVKP